MSCTVAAAKARRNSSRCDACMSETMVLVTEVPMLAPMMMGIACLTRITGGDEAPVELALGAFRCALLTVRTDHRHDDGRGRGGGLDQDRDEDTDHESDDGVAQQV